MSRSDSSRARRRAVLAGLTLSCLLAACGPASTTPPPASSPAASEAPSVPPSTSPAPALLLEVTGEGGFINPSATIAAVPQVVVDADGRIYTPDDGSSVAAGSPLVPPMDVRDVGSSGLTEIIAAIRAAGLDREEAGGGIVADTGSVVFTAVVDGNEIVNRFGRVGGGPGVPGVGGPGGSGGDAAAAFDLLARLTDPSVAWGGSVAAATPYAPVGYRVYAAPGAADAGSGATPVAWPLATDLADFGVPAVPDLGVPGLRSGIVTGDAAAVLAPVLGAATTTTTFESAGRPYTLWVRPLLPDELGG